MISIKRIVSCIVIISLLMLTACGKDVEEPILNTESVTSLTDSSKETTHYIDDNHIDDIFKILDSIKIDTYYVNMANAWVLCECFIKERDKTLKYLKTSKLNKQSFNKGIQKCIESFRVSKDDKNYLRTIKKV